MMFTEKDEYWMRHALALAARAEAAGEVPVGAVLVLNDEIIGEGYNQPISTHDPTGHAEIIALRAGALVLQNYRLVNSTLYVTLEPCLMCAGALVHARIKRLVYGATDPKTGVITSQINAPDFSFLNHRLLCQGGLLAPACGEIVSVFFQKKRKNMLGDLPQS